MASTEIFHVNYYTGGMLAYGGNLWVDGDAVHFSPTGSLDRAMGAKDFQISFHQIRGLQVGGALSQSFTIQTDEKVHKFQGSQAKRAWAQLEKMIPGKGAPTACAQC